MQTKTSRKTTREGKVDGNNNSEFLSVSLKHYITSAFRETTTKQKQPKTTKQKKIKGACNHCVTDSTSHGGDGILGVLSWKQVQNFCNSKAEWQGGMREKASTQIPLFHVSDESCKCTSLTRHISLSLSLSLFLFLSLYIFLVLSEIQGSLAWAIHKLACVISWRLG